MGSFWRFFVIGIILLAIGFSINLFASIVAVSNTAFIKNVIALIFSLFLRPFATTFYFLVYEDLRRLKSEVPFEKPKRKTKIKYILIGIVGFLLIFVILPLLIVVPSLQKAREKAKNAKVMADMLQIQTVAELISMESEDYSKVSCLHPELTSLCKDIEDLTGKKPIIHTSQNAYCVYAKLLDKGYYCADSKSGGERTDIFPGKNGYCDGKTFVCPPLAPKTGDLKNINGIEGKMADSNSSKQIPKAEQETANWKTYRNEKLGIRFKYPSGWASPEIKEESMGKCRYQEVYLPKKGAIQIRPKTDSAFLCFQPEPYFECGNYYFECSPYLTSFNCKPYKDASGNYNSMEILNDLKAQGFDCSISMSRPYASYIYNPELLQEQFQILEKASKTTELNPGLKEEIKSDFTLFRSILRLGSDDRFYIGLIYNPQIESQGIKIIGYEGSDVSAANYYYQAVFLKDNKIISLRFSLFPDELFEWANQEMVQMKQGKSFDERIVDDIKNQRKGSPIYETVQKYDLLAKSFSI